MRTIRILSQYPTAAGLALLLAFVCSAAAADPPISIDSKVDAGQLVMSYQGRKLLVYAFATNQFKPYVRELYTLRGENVLRDSPPDHQHHHGLMYAVYVNGINFWEERDAPGFEKHVELPVHMARVDANGTPVASFTEIIHWLAPTNRTAPDSLAAARLLEQRRRPRRVGCHCRVRRGPRQRSLSCGAFRRKVHAPPVYFSPHPFCHPDGLWLFPCC